MTKDNEIKWISVKDQVPSHSEPIVYCRRKDAKTWHVGIAYWTVSKKWNPELNSTHALQGFTHWLPLPDVPDEKRSAE